MNSGASESWVELAWSEREEGYGFITQRVEKYHWEAAVSFAEVGLSKRRLKGVPAQFPSESFIAEAVDKIVLGAKEPKQDQNGQKPERKIPPCPEPASALKQTAVSVTISIDALNYLEHDFVYKGYLQALISGENSVGRQVYAILTDATLCHKSNVENVALQTVENYVAQSEADQLPLMFVLPGFPFKDQNPFNTNAVPPWHVDGGEVALLLRLHLLALALRQVYPFGCEFIVLSDGPLYAALFDVPRESALRYVGRLRQFRNYLNLQRSVHLLDLEEACHLLPEYNKMVGEVTKRIEKLQTNTKIAQAIKRLTISMVRNLGYPSATEKQLASVWGLMHGESPVDEFEHQMLERARKCAIRYLGINVTISWLGVYKAVFPFATRCTVHPKPDQIAIPMCDSLPWNGCPVWDGKEFKVCRYHELPRSAVAAHPDAWEHPFTFELEQKEKFNPSSKAPVAVDPLAAGSV